MNFHFVISSFEMFINEMNKLKFRHGKDAVFRPSSKVKLSFSHNNAQNIFSQ